MEVGPSVCCRNHIGSMDVALHIRRHGPQKMCRLATELLEQAELNRDLARRARGDALRRDNARDKARMLRHAAELEELASQILLQANTLMHSGFKIHAAA